MSLSEHGLGPDAGVGIWATQAPARERVSFNTDWRFTKDDPNGAAGKLSYNSIRDWVIMTGAEFTNDPNFANKKRPVGNPGYRRRLHTAGIQ